MNRLVVATTNPGKVREINGILAGVEPRITLVALDQFPGLVEPEETGETFADNARLKALYYAAATGLPAVADDSGLEIDALNNAPGLHSARWYGTDYDVKFRKIYELGGLGSPARFVCYVALADHGHVLFESTGIVHGQIAPEPKGTNGFGYDPIFFYPPFNCTLAELDLERKATVSHRGWAFKALRDYLSRDPGLGARGSTMGHRSSKSES
jgi:XTP/dITP diphosphohydrolase